jgi:hypothetical protein
MRETSGAERETAICGENDIEEDWSDWEGSSLLLAPVLKDEESLRQLSPPTP